MPKNPHAVALGSRKSAKKAAAARANGQRGGRPGIARKALERIALSGDLEAARIIAVGALRDLEAALARDRRRRHTTRR